MPTWWYFFPALKPERTLISHFAFWIAVLAYSGLVTDWSKLEIGVVGFLLFYGAVYLMNDILDFDTDTADKHNKRRVIASGQLRRGTAGYLAIFFWLISLVILWWSSEITVGIALILWGIN